MTTADLDRIKDRIRQSRKLTALAGCTEAEALQAAEAVRLAVGDLWWRRAQEDGNPEAIREADRRHLEALNTDLEWRGIQLETMRAIGQPGARYADAGLQGLQAGGRVAIDPGLSRRAGRSNRGTKKGLNPP